MAVVYEVIDRQDGRKLALKRLHRHARPERAKHAQALFEHEFYTLAQLKHPRIVEVYDYGLDELGPFYTMELLDGGDLQRRAPVPHDRVAQHAADICSALSLLHSRRLLHRDVSPRNIRCTSDGTAKLIDFGVMAHVGPSKDLVATPAFAAPELVNLQPIDARTDLFALGASLYFALTGRNAYPARDFEDLPQLWRQTVPRPSEIDPGIPDALDQLVLDLLQLDPKDRPASAAEVLDRLVALDCRPSPRGAVIEAQAYLSTPAFVGREPELSRVRSNLQRARGQRGGAALAVAAAGFGRSRFLDAVVLSGKLLGMTVLRAYADESEPGEYRAVRALLLQLEAALPDATRAAMAGLLPVLGHIAPELAAGAEVELQAFEDRTALRPQLQHALRKVLRAVSAEHPLLIAIDDLPLLDEPSVAALALLAREVNDCAVQIVATALADSVVAEDSAFRLYAELAIRVTLHPLTHAQAHQLLASVFGDTAHLDNLVDQLMQRTEGSPRDLMRLAQHLVDRNVVRYHAGAWSLPARLDPSELPASIAQVLHASASALENPLRVLASTFALCPDHSFTFDECRVLSGGLQPTELARQLGKLVTAEVLRSTAERYALGDRAYVPVLLSLLGKADTQTAHARLAEALSTRGDDEAFRVAQHLLRAGRQAEAMDVFVTHAVDSQTLTDSDPDAFYKLVRALPEDWLSTYEEALALAPALERPQAQLFALRTRMAGIVGTTGLRATSHIAALIEELALVVGLRDYAQLDPALGPHERLKQALAAAQARYLATPEHARICEPEAAISALARATLTAIGMYAPLLDPAGVRALPSLAPLALLSPSLIVVPQLCEGVYARLTGRMDRALAIYKAVLERTAQPDRAGLNVSQHRFTRLIVMSVIAMIEASMGLDSSLSWAAQLESDPLSQVNALQVRVLHRLWQGDCLQAEREQREVDARRIESGARQNQEATHLLWQVIAHAGMEDLTRLRRTVEEVRRIGENLPGWRPVISYGTAEYQRARGDLRRAIVELQDMLAIVKAGEHQIWPNLAAAHVRALDDARRSAEAVQCGLRYCAEAERAELGFSAQYIALPLAVAEAKQGVAEAAARAERVIEHFRALGTTGLSLALAYEARIRVAIAQLDRASFERYVELYERDCLASGGEALAAKLHRLKREAQRKQLIAAPALDALSQQSIKSKLLGCSGAAERAHVMLSVLAASCGASEGFLYLIGEQGPAWVASVGSRAAPPEALDRLAREYVATQTLTELDVTADVPPEEAATEWTTLGDASYQPMLLSHYSQSGVHVVTGLLVLLVNHEKKFVRSEFATQMSRVAVEIGDSQPASQRDPDELLEADESSA